MALCCFSFFSRDAIWGHYEVKYALEFFTLVEFGGLQLQCLAVGSGHADVQLMDCNFRFTVPVS